MCAESSFATSRHYVLHFERCSKKHKGSDVLAAAKMRVGSVKTRIRLELQKALGFGDGSDGDDTGCENHSVKRKADASMPPQRRRTKDKANDYAVVCDMSSVQTTAAANTHTMGYLPSKELDNLESSVSYPTWTSLGTNNTFFEQYTEPPPRAGVFRASTMDWNSNAYLSFAGIDPHDNSATSRAQ